MGNKKIRLGLVGVGNCAASLVEGIVFYKDQGNRRQGRRFDALQCRGI